RVSRAAACEVHCVYGDSPLITVGSADEKGVAGPQGFSEDSLGRWGRGVRGIAWDRPALRVRRIARGEDEGGSYGPERTRNGACPGFRTRCKHDGRVSLRRRLERSRQGA